jgi:hypothetical protein
MGVAAFSVAASGVADPLNCRVTGYQAAAGLSAAVANDVLTVTWEGDKDAELRLQFAIDRGAPTIRELAIRRKGAMWRTLATNVTPEFRIVSGIRRVTQQQTQPLERLGVKLTSEVLDTIKWEAFWDAPLFIDGSGELPPTHQGSIPAATPYANHPGLPRKPEEVTRADASYQVRSCEVKTNGARLEITFPGVEAGIFSGRHAIISMPHPRSKGSTGYPETIKDSAHFVHENYHGVGYRWGMGVDASETRLCEYRCLALFDDMSNWFADRPGPLKYLQAISEARSDIGHRGKPPWDDTYGMSPVNYVRLDRLPTSDDMSPIINALKRGDYFVTSGEVLISSYAVQGTGDRRTIVAEVEWTFPLDFVEVVWGDGRTTDREIVSTTDLPPFGRKRFEIPFNAAGKKWVRFAAWDVATNGAFVQPIRLQAGTRTTASR